MPLSYKSSINNLVFDIREIALGIHLFSACVKDLARLQGVCSLITINVHSKFGRDYFFTRSQCSKIHLWAKLQPESANGDYLCQRQQKSYFLPQYLTCLRLRLSQNLLRVWLLQMFCHNLKCICIWGYLNPIFRLKSNIGKL